MDSPTDNLISVEYIKSTFSVGYTSLKSGAFRKTCYDKAVFVSEKRGNRKRQSVVKQSQK